jgi:hypothetical protein
MAPRCLKWWPCTPSTIERRETTHGRITIRHHLTNQLPLADLPPIDRWREVGKAYASQSHLIIEYFTDILPIALVDIITSLAKNIVDYPGWGEFGDEMKGYSEGLGLDLGYVVAANLVYQMESVGVTCSNWNNTGPTGQCKGEIDPDEIIWIESDHYKRTTASPIKAGGYCTSVVANDQDGGVLHGRNLDWNLEEKIRPLVVDVEFFRGGEYLYTGTSIVSFVGLLNAMRPSNKVGGSEETTGGFSVSQNARCQGGHLLTNILEALKLGAMTPEQHSRVVMESATDFDSAVLGFQSGNLIDEAYLVVGGDAPNQGAVVSRSRNWAANTWVIGDEVNSNADGNWYRLETNYDHWEEVPAADDRRTPGFANMDAIGETAITTKNLFDDVMTVWPTMNPHTDMSCIISAAKNLYDCNIFLD